MRWAMLCLFSFASAGLAAPGDVLFSDNLNGNLNKWTVVSGGGDASVGNETANQGRSLRLRWGAVSVTSEVINAAVPGVRLEVWIRRGSDSFSEDPDDNEDLLVEYLNDTGSWSTLEFFQGNGTPGEIFPRSYLLAADALHPNLQIRLRMTGGSGVDWDYWHVDDVILTETLPPQPFGLGSCEDFEAGLGNWTVIRSGGDGGVSSATAGSPSSSLFTRWGIVTVTSAPTDLSGALFVNLDAWVRRGADSFSEDPDNNENLVIEFLDDTGSWIALETFAGQSTPGEIFTRSYSLSSAAMHANFQIRFRQTGGSGADWDYWHIDDVCLTSALQVSYSFEETQWTGTAGEVLDGGPDALHGTAVGGAVNDSATPAIPTDPGTCRYADLDGIDDYIEIADDPALDLRDELTIAAWVNLRSMPSSLYTIVSKDWNYEFHINSSGQVYWWWHDTSGTARTLTTALSLGPNQWHHIAITYESGAQTIYVDGAPAASSSYTGALRLNDVPLFIGTDWMIISRAFDGFLDEVNVLSRALPPNEVQALTNQAHPCPVAGAAFVINHDTFAIHCVSETVTVNVVDANAGTPLTSYNATVRLDTQSGNGTWSLVNGGGSFSDTTADDGVASYDWPLGESEAVFELSYTQGTPTINVDVYQISDPGIRDNDAEGDLVFSPNGFTVTGAPLSNPPPPVVVPFDAVQTAAVPFALHITAYGQTPNDPVCGVIESYSGNKNLKFWSQYLNPISGATAVEVDGLSIATSEAAAAPQSVNFLNGQAVVTAKYKDVGVKRVLMKDDTTVNAELPGGIRGASAGFVVRPARFVLSDIRNAPGTVVNPQAADALGPVFIAAGTPFRATVTALDAEGDPTPNYGQEINPETVRLDVQLVAPVGGAEPPVSAVAGFGAFSAGAATGFDFIWPEVGIIRLNPGVGDSDYLGAGDINGDPSEFVGRFVPDHFANAMNVPMFQTACAAGAFTYTGQAFNYLVAPVISVTARAAGGSTTLNYTGPFFKLATNTLQNRIYTSAVGTLDISGVPPVTTDPAVSEASPGVGSVVFSGGMGLRFARDAPQAPFAADIELSVDVIDGDGVAALGNPATFGAGGGILFSAGAEIRYGRVRLMTALGSELVTLPVPMMSEHYGGAGIGFVLNAGDSCTTGVSLVFSGFTENLDPGETCVLDIGSPGASGVGCPNPAPAGSRFEEPPLAGDFGVRLAPPGEGNQGGLIVTGSVPNWLKFDWNVATAGDEDPSAQITFGIFGGSSRQIYSRELY